MKRWTRLLEIKENQKVKAFIKKSDYEKTNKCLNSSPF